MSTIILKSSILVMALALGGCGESQVAQTEQGEGHVGMEGGVMMGGQHGGGGDHQGGGMMGKMMEMMGHGEHGLAGKLMAHAEHLKLSDEQLGKIARLQQQYKKTQEQIKEKLHKSMMSFREESMNPSADIEKLRSAGREHGEAFNAMVENAILERQEILAILTPDQQTQFKSMKMEEHAGHGGGQGGHEGHGG
jgi:hypothetical protein